MKEGRIHLKILIELELRSIIGLFLLFLFFGLTALLSQIYLEDLMKLAGFQIIGLPKPSVLAVLIDFWGDLSLTGGIIAIFYGMRAFSADLNVNKQVFFVLNHPISRNNHYLSKSILRIVVFNAVIIISSIIVYWLAASVYGGYEILNVIKAIIMVSLGGSAFLAVILGVNSAVTTGTTAIIGILFLFIQIIIGFLSGFIQWLQWLSPVQLSNKWTFALAGTSITLELLALILWNLIPIFIGMLYYSKRDL